MLFNTLFTRHFSPIQLRCTLFFFSADIEWKGAPLMSTMHRQVQYSALIVRVNLFENPNCLPPLSIFELWEKSCRCEFPAAWWHSLTTEWVTAQHWSINQTTFKTCIQQPLRHKIRSCLWQQVNQNDLKKNNPVTNEVTATTCLIKTQNKISLRLLSNSTDSFKMTLAWYFCCFNTPKHFQLYSWARTPKLTWKS